MIRRPAGFTLIELLVALGIGGALLAALVSLAEAFAHTLNQQAALADLQERTGFAVQELELAVATAGSVPDPWVRVDRAPAVAESVAGATPAGDRLTVRRRSRLNCVDGENPVRDADGLPAAWWLRSSYEVRPRGLVRTCHYGPGPEPGTRQLNAATLVEGVEALVLRFGEDHDGDGRVDDWVEAGGWHREERLLAVRFGFLVAGPPRAGAPASPPVELLGRRLHPPADGRPRRAVIFTAPIRSRL